MLDREKLAKDVFSIVSKLFPDLSNESDLARKKWNDISVDDTFMHRADCAKSSFLIPTWDGNLTDTFLMKDSVEQYSVLAVDGSQIYPDRHVSGAGCFLVNAGGVFLEYPGGATFFSDPHVLLPSDLTKEIGEIAFSRDLVDFKREEYELAVTVEKALEKKTACFMDGTIVFWPLDGKPQEVKEYFLQRYLYYLNELYRNEILACGYISMPKSRELVNLIKLGLCRFTIADCIRCHKECETFPCKEVDHLLDAHVARFFLKKYERTTVFYSTSKIVELYPKHLRPAFVYCDVGSEIVRLEIPRWIAQDKTKLDYLCSLAIDQSRKGGGYPVCLAEAHEQAVVKGGDRDFFYHLLCKVGMEHNKKIKISQKSKKKLRIGV